MSAFKKADSKQILDWVSKDNLKPFYAYILSGSVHGKPGIPVAELARIKKIISESLSDEESYKLGKVFLKRSEYTARVLGISFVQAGWPKHKDVEKLLWTAADDADWIVRECAAGGFANMLERDFGYFSKLFLKWVKLDNVNIKRAIALAVKYDCRVHDSKKWKVYLSLIEPLLSEEAEYVRINLGQFAIGDGLIKGFSTEILGNCQKWSVSKNENVRWNVAMIFTAAAAKKHKSVGIKILSRLEADQSAFVARAAKKAIRKLG